MENNKQVQQDNKSSRFFRCVIFKKEFDDNQQSIPWDLLKKGQEVLLTGKFPPNTWTDKDGVEHQDLEIVVKREPLSIKAARAYARAAFLCG